MKKLQLFILFLLFIMNDGFARMAKMVTIGQVRCLQPSAIMLTLSVSPTPPTHGVAVSVTTDNLSAPFQSNLYRLICAGLAAPTSSLSLGRPLICHHDDERTDT